MPGIVMTYHIESFEIRIELSKFDVSYRMEGVLPPAPRYTRVLFMLMLNEQCRRTASNIEIVHINLDLILRFWVLA